MACRGTFTYKINHLQNLADGPYRVWGVVCDIDGTSHTDVQCIAIPNYNLALTAVASCQPFRIGSLPCTDGYGIIICCCIYHNVYATKTAPREIMHTVHNQIIALSL